MIALIAGASTLALLTLAWLRVLHPDEPVRLHARSLDTLFAAIVATVATVGLISLALGVAGAFHPYFVLLACLCLVTALSLTRRARQYSLVISLGRPSFGWGAVGTIAIIATAMALYLPAFEEISLHQDGNVYLESGVNMARTGSLIERHSELANMTPREREVFFDIQDPANSSRIVDGKILPTMSGVFHGFIIADPESGTVLPQYLHLLPSLYGFAFAFGGLAGALLVAPILATLLIVLVTRVTANLFGTAAGMVAGALLAINPIQVWFGRYPNPEMLTAGLLFAGVLALILRSPEEGSGGSWVGMFLLASAQFARLDAILFASGVVVWILVHLLGRTWNAAVTRAVATYVMISSAAAAYYALVPAAYLNSIASLMFEQSMELRPLLWGVAVLGLVVSGTLFVIATRSRRPLSAVHPLAMTTRGAFVLLSVVPLVGYVAYAFITRASAPISIGWRNVEMLSWYFGELALVLGLLGVMTLAVLVRSRSAILLFTILAHTSTFYLYHLANQNLHPWGMRRYVDTVIPLAIIAFAAIAFASLPSRIDRRVRVIRLTSGAIAVTIAASAMLPYTYVLAEHQEFQGLTKQTEEVAAEFDEDDILLLHNQFSLPSIGPALRYLHGKDAILLWKEPEDERSLTIYGDRVNAWLRGGRDVFVVNPSPTFLEELGWHAELAATEIRAHTLSTPKLVFAQFARADAIATASSSFRVFSLTVSPSFNSVVESADVANNQMRGFHDAETSNEGSFRWTSDRASLRFSVTEPGKYLLHLNFSTARPQGVEPANATVEVAGVQLGLEETARRQEAIIPIAIERPELLELTLTSSLWIPAHHLASQDVRTLGIRFFSAYLEGPLNGTEAPTEPSQLRTESVYLHQPDQLSQPQIDALASAAPRLVLVEQEPRNQSSYAKYAEEIAEAIKERPVHILNPSSTFLSHAYRLGPFELTPVDPWRANGSLVTAYEVRRVNLSTLRAFDLEYAPPSTLRNFHMLENSTAGYFQWTKNESAILLAGPVRTGNHTLLLDVSGFRPTTAAPLNASLHIGDTSIPLPEFGGARTRLSLNLSLNDAEWLQIFVHSTTWNPSEHLASGDTRQLGFRIYRVELIEPDS